MFATREEARDHATYYGTHHFRNRSSGSYVCYEHKKFNKDPSCEVRRQVRSTNYGFEVVEYG